MLYLAAGAVREDGFEHMPVRQCILRSMLFTALQLVISLFLRVSKWQVKS